MALKAKAGPALPASPSFATRVVNWQRQHGRAGLPWQGLKDPYRVWLSEIMLQQTQVATALPYYERFVSRMPTVQALAAAPVDEVLALWSGLGYYSRARNLHRAAQMVVAEQGGEFPSTAQQLVQLPGVGRSTAAAIAAFCFEERVAILDGNVKRVLARHLAFAGDLAKPAQLEALWQQANLRLPARRQAMPAYTQGMMDLGATVCLAKAPACQRCPVAQDCQALAQGRVLELPVKIKRLVRRERRSWWLWLTQGTGPDRYIWLVQRPSTGVWAGLWAPPLFDSLGELEQATARCGAVIEPSAGEQTAPIKHVLTHFDWLLHPVWAKLAHSRLGQEPQSREANPLAATTHVQAMWATGRWVSPPQALNLALPSPVTKLVRRLAGLGS